MDELQYYARLKELLENRQPVWQITIVAVKGSSPAKPGMKLAVPLEDREFGNIGGGALEHMAIALARETQPREPTLRTYVLSESGDTVLPENTILTGMICGGEATLYIEPLGIIKPLYIIGAGHCGRALGELALRGGYHVVLIDNRQEILAGEMGGYCHQAVWNDYGDISQAVRFNADASIVIMTHGHAHDAQVLEQCLSHTFRYLGMIGSRRKAAQTIASLIQKGFAEELVSRVKTPIGLPIGSQTPYEIAVSIMAELICVERKVAQAGGCQDGK